MAACVAACAAVRAEGGPEGVPVVVGDDPASAAPAADQVPEAAEAVEGPDLATMSSVIVEGSSCLGGCVGPGPEAASACGDDLDDWTAIATFDVLFLQRANTVGPLAVASQASDIPGATVISASDVRYPTIPGMRVFHGWRNDESGGWEVGYLGAWSMHADAVAVSPTGSLALPGGLGLVAGSGFDAATVIQPTLDASLNSAEFNVFSTRVYGGCRRHDPLPWRRSWDVLEGTTARADWIMGIRWAGIDETANLAVTAATPGPSTTAYRVTTSTQFVGPQLGHRRRVAWGDWALEGWMKVALVGSLLSQSQGSVVGPFDLVPIRGPQSSTSTGVGMIGDINASAVRRLGDHWSVRAGYTLLWFAGAAPAANQWDFANTPTSGPGIERGTVFLHGATLGVEAAW
ncbi:MAG: hypothetical protein ACKOZU_05615 [Planctomycetaceae bacterium]